MGNGYNHVNIAIQKKTYERLKDAGRAGDSFNDVICMLLEQDRAKEKNPKPNLRELIDEIK
jgi:predicted CopG family antitoxin